MCGLPIFQAVVLRPHTSRNTAVSTCGRALQAGREGVEAEWEKTDEFHEKWRLEARKVLASQEWRKRKLTKRVRESTWPCILVNALLPSGQCKTLCANVA
jgi:hypothetical protein